MACGLGWAILTIQTDPLFSSHASVVAFRVLGSSLGFRVSGLGHGSEVLLFVLQSFSEAQIGRLRILGLRDLYRSGGTRVEATHDM